MNKITWSIFTAAVIGLMALLVVMSNQSKIDVSKVDTKQTQVANLQNGNIAEHVFGKADSKVVLIEYGDFQCPACGTQFPTTKAIAEYYKDQIKVIFRNFPLTSIHPNAKISAAAAEAAGLQGKFWEMHDMLYQKQSDWENLTGDARVDALVGYAKALNLDESKFKTDISSKEVLAKLSYDQALGTKDKIEGTPSFFLNGKLLSGDDWSDLDKFKAVINKELTANNIEVPTPGSNN